MIIALGATSQSVTIEVYDDSGLPVTGLDAGTMPIIAWRRGAEDVNLLQTDIHNLDAITDPWEDSGLIEVFQGRYRLDLPNAMWESVAKISLWAEGAGKHMMPITFEVKDELTAEDVAAATAAALSGLDIDIQSAWDGGILEIFEGAEYSVANGNYVDWDASALPDLTGGAAKIHFLNQRGSIVADEVLSIINPGTLTQKIRFTLSGTESAKVKAPDNHIGNVLFKTSGATTYAPWLKFGVVAKRL